MGEVLNGDGNRFNTPNRWSFQISANTLQEWGMEMYAAINGAVYILWMYWISVSMGVAPNVTCI